MPHMQQTPGQFQPHPATEMGNHSPISNPQGFQHPAPQGSQAPNPQGMNPSPPQPRGMQMPGAPPGIPHIPNPAAQAGAPMPPPAEPEPEGVPQEIIDRDCRIMTYAEAMAEEAERAFQQESKGSDADEDTPSGGEETEDAEDSETSDDSVHGKCAAADPENFTFVEKDAPEEEAHEEGKCGCASKPKSKTVFIQGLQV
eukprot:562174-Rhodomonas_salina.2